MVWKYDKGRVSDHLSKGSNATKQGDGDRWFIMCPLYKRCEKDKNVGGVR